MAISPNQSKKVEESIFFLIDEYRKSGHNPKPVVLHSLRVACYLMGHNYETDIIVAAVLHDLLEDSAVTKNDLERNFGKTVASLVEVLTFKAEIEDEQERYKEMFGRILKYGQTAMIIKCADIYDNSAYIHLVKNIDKERVLIQKMGYLLDLSRPTIGGEPVWQDLMERYEEEKKRARKTYQILIG